MALFNPCKVVSFFSLTTSVCRNRNSAHAYKNASYLSATILILQISYSLHDFRLFIFDPLGEMATKFGNTYRLLYYAIFNGYYILLSCGNVFLSINNVIIPTARCRGNAILTIRFDGDHRRV